MNAPEGSTRKRQRCAVYTRKSTEEGLDQDYNSIDAQRDAGQAYIASQRAESEFDETHPGKAKKLRWLGGHVRVILCRLEHADHQTVDRCQILEHVPFLVRLRQPARTLQTQGRAHRGGQVELADGSHR